MLVLPFLVGFGLPPRELRVVRLECALVDVDYHGALLEVHRQQPTEPQPMVDPLVRVVPDLRRVIATVGQTEMLVHDRGNCLWTWGHRQVMGLES